MKVLKTFWEHRRDGRYAINDLQGLDLLGRDRSGIDFFAIDNDLVVLQGPPLAGTIQFFMCESIVPVVANVTGENTLRCVGTAFFISCTGLLITAAHVITDPIERKYGKTVEQDDFTLQAKALNFGVLLPNNTVFQVPGYSFLPFEWAYFLAERRDNPLPIPGLDLKLTSDIAICKVPPRRNRPHQPLTIIQSGITGVGMRPGSRAYALGYAGMTDFEIEFSGHGQLLADRRFQLHGSVGNIIEHFPENLEKKEVSTPGPCFSFQAIVHGGMSGGPIFDREGVYVHGVISKGLEEELGPVRLSFGSMIRPSMGLPLTRMSGASLAELQEKHNEGMPIMRGPDF